jgi:hypothetical protein
LIFSMFASSTLPTMVSASVTRLACREATLTASAATRTVWLETKSMPSRATMVIRPVLA